MLGCYFLNHFIAVLNHGTLFESNTMKFKNKLIMKLVVKIFMVLLLFSTTSMLKAQEASVENQLETYKQKLNLSASQYENVKKILSEAKAARKANETKYANDKKALMDANRTVRQNADMKIEALLDAKQKEIYTQLKQEKKEQHQQSNVQDKVEKRTADLTAKLGLSPDQSSKVKAVFSEYLPKIQAIKSQYASDEASAKAKMQPIRKEMNSKLMSILTEEQKQKYKAIKDKE